MTGRTQLTRLRELGSTDRAALDALLDSTPLGHFGLLDDVGRPVVISSAIVRDGDRVLTHGSTGAGWLRRLPASADTCLTVTALDGLVVARSAFESSMHYRSAVLFGSWSAIEGAEKETALDVITERLIPGRTGEVRPPTRRELQATLVLALPIAEWSLKVSCGWPEDPDSDVEGDAWAGVVPLTSAYSTPRPAPDLRAGIALPASVQALAADGPGAP